MGQTNKIGRTYISARALSMDIGTSAVEEIVLLSSLAISVVNFLMFRKVVKPSRGKVKQIYSNKCVPTTGLNLVNTVVEPYRKTHNINVYLYTAHTCITSCLNYGKHNRTKTHCQSAKSSLYRKFFYAIFFHWINSRCHWKRQSFNVKIFLWNLS